LRSQVGAALLHLVAQFAPGKGGEGGIAELLPGGAQPLLQRADIGIKDLWLVHAAAISRRGPALIRPDSLTDAYSAAGRKKKKTYALQRRERESYMIVGC
jgi:hypothetical protein